MTESNLPTTEAEDLARVQEQMVPVEFAQPAPAAATALPSSSAGEAEAPPASEAEVSTVPFEPCAGPNLLLCDTFEDATIGEFPDDPQWQAELSGCGTHVVDGAGVSLSGSQALRANGGGYPECMLHADLNGETDVYVRSWVRLGSESDLLSQYFSLLEWGPSESQDEPELRIGLRPGSDGLCTTSPGLDVSVSGLERGSATDCTGFRFEAERWYCVQARLTREESRLSISLAVDGETLLEQEYTSLGDAWKGADLYFKLGRAPYGASAGGSLWHDDVAVGRDLPPCGP